MFGFMRLKICTYFFNKYFMKLWTVNYYRFNILKRLNTFDLALQIIVILLKLQKNIVI